MSFFEGVYREKSSPYGDAPDPFLVEHLAPARDATALDAGGGTGRNALWLARNGCRVELVDSSAAAVQKAAARAAAEGLPLTATVADLRGWQAERGYDLVMCAITLHAFKARRATAVAAALREAVNPGGHLFISLHLAGGQEQREREQAKQNETEPRTYLTNGHQKRLFSLEEARDLLGWEPVTEAVASGERCPRAECPYVHDVYRAIAQRPGDF